MLLGHDVRRIPMQYSRAINVITLMAWWLEICLHLRLELFSPVGLFETGATVEVQRQCHP
jgi:hypothetical protein